MSTTLEWPAVGATAQTGRSVRLRERLAGPVLLVCLLTAVAVYGVIGWVVWHWL